MFGSSSGSGKAAAGRPTGVAASSKPGAAAPTSTGVPVLARMASSSSFRPPAGTFSTAAGHSAAAAGPSISRTGSFTSSRSGTGSSAVPILAGILAGPSSGADRAALERDRVGGTAGRGSSAAPTVATGAGGVAGVPGGSAAAAAGGAGGARRDKLRFTLKDVVMQTTVGTGTFGRVRVVQYKPTKQTFAMKILKKSEIIRLKQVEHIKSEVKILAAISHPFIVNMMGHTQDERRIYLMFEYVPGGELFSYLRRETRFGNDQARYYAAQIALAFEYLHSTNIVYRDLKPENLLLNARGNMKITDFGFAKVVEDRTWTLCGTPEYLAPEIIQSKGHNKAVDWWAIGILIFEMLAGYPPFFDESPFGIYQKILGGKIDFPKHFSAEARDLVRKLLTADKTKRLGCLRGGATDIKEHPWFARLNWEALFACTLPAPHVPRLKDERDTSNFEDYPDSDSEVTGRDTAGRLSSKEAELFAEFDTF